MNLNVAVLLIMLISLIVPILIGYVFITYITSLENNKDCACSNNPKRKYVKYYGYVLIFSAIFSFVSGMFYINVASVKSIDNIFKTLVLIIHFLGTYVIFSYSKLIEENPCKCSDGWKRVFIKYYGYFITVMVGLLFFGLLASFLMLITHGEDKSILDIKRLILGCGK